MPSSLDPMAQPNEQSNTSLESSPQIPPHYDTSDEIIPPNIAPKRLGTNVIEKLAQVVTLLSQTEEVTLDDLKRFLKDRVATHSRANTVETLTWGDCAAAQSWLLGHGKDQETKIEPTQPRATRRSARSRLETPAGGTDNGSDIAHSCTPDQPDSQYQDGSETVLSQEDELPYDHSFDSPVSIHQRITASVRKRRQTANTSPSRPRKEPRRCDTATSRPETAVSGHRPEATVPLDAREHDAQVAAQVALGLMEQREPQNSSGKLNDLDNVELKSYISWLKDQEAHATARLASTQSHHETLSQQRNDRQRNIQRLTSDREAVENQIHQADANAQQAARDIDASSSILRNIRTLVDSHPSVYPEEVHSTLSALQNRHRSIETSPLQAGDDYEARKNRLKKICDDLETNQATVTTLDARIEREKTTMEEQERAERAIVVMSRLAELGPSSLQAMDGNVFEALEEWTKKKMAEKNEVTVL